MFRRKFRIHPFARSVATDSSARERATTYATLIANLNANLNARRTTATAPIIHKLFMDNDLSYRFASICATNAARTRLTGTLVR
jgi:hypothetical protein